MKKLNLILSLLFLTQMLFAQPGTLDTSFDPGDGFSGNSSDFVKAIAVQPDGKIILGGTFQSYDGISKNNLIRVNPNGSLDSTFIGNGTNSPVNALALLSDGKILVGGEFTTYNGASVSRIIRLHSDGSLDSSFFSGTMTGSAPISVDVIAIQPDDKILIGGKFNSYNGAPANFLTRLENNGFQDITFASGSSVGPNGQVRSIDILNNGQILIAGYFTAYSGSTKNYLAKINADGSLYSAFNTGVGPSSFLEVVKAQADGMILIGGTFSQYDNDPVGYLVRLDTVGNLDPLFLNGAANYGVLALGIQNDGKILLGGNFTIYNGSNTGNFTRIHPNGDLDTAFYAGAGIGPFGSVRSLAIQPDDKILIGGFFAFYNAIYRRGIARINGNVTVSIEQAAVAQKIKAYPNPTHSAFTIELGEMAETLDLRLYNLQGQLIRSEQHNHCQQIQMQIDAPPGSYFVEVVDEKGQKATLKVLKE